MPVGQPVDLAGGAGPVPELRVGVVGVRADHGNGPAACRLRVARPVFGPLSPPSKGSVPSLREQDQGSAGHLQVDGGVLGAIR